MPKPNLRPTNKLANQTRHQFEWLAPLATCPGRKEAPENQNDIVPPKAIRERPGTV
jgi:hypothetical protein